MVFEQFTFANLDSEDSLVVSCQDKYDNSRSLF